MSHPIVSGSETQVAVGLLAWNFEPAVTIPVALAAVVYGLGWVRIRRRLPERFGARRPAAFAAGLSAIVLALCSPLDTAGAYLLRAHMVQHMLLMLVAPPLLWAGAPLAPLLLGLPLPLRRAVAAALAAVPVRRLLTFLTHPVTSWIAFAAAFWIWHMPAAYELALASDPWHHVEHLCFFGAAMLFWRPVILAWPARSPWPRWAMVPYLLLAELQNTILAAILSFADRVIYPTYAALPSAGTLSALEDQSLAGVIMWVPGSVAFLVPLLWLVLTTITGPPAEAQVEAQPALRRR
ncbi:MAG TPA: cytochrome c oxidase assembly protein [Candidatus Bathyarchaeia archaeon]|nr:cytochrome c oxidase assembly protein [Candidatus Bathyarchaeia archaeon]